MVQGFPSHSYGKIPYLGRSVRSSFLSPPLRQPVTVLTCVRLLMELSWGLFQLVQEAKSEHRTAGEGGN